jgi:hypothetical protein
VPRNGASPLFELNSQCPNSLSSRMLQVKRLLATHSYPSSNIVLLPSGLIRLCTQVTAFVGAQLTLRLPLAIHYEIQHLGHWRSDAYKIHIDTPPDHALHLSARLHLALAPLPAPYPLALPRVQRPKRYSFLPATYVLVSSPPFHSSEA